MTSTSEKRLGGQSFECALAKTGGGYGRMRIVMGPLEAYIAEMVFAVADSNELRAAMAPDDNDDTGQELRAVIAKDEDALTRLGNEKDDGLITDA